MLSRTFDADKGRVFHLAQLAGSDASVIGRLLYVFQDEDVAADGQRMLRLQVLQAFAPLDVGHGRAAGHASDVERRAGLDLVDRLQRHRKVGRHAAHFYLSFLLVGRKIYKVKETDTENGPIRAAHL